MFAYRRWFYAAQCWVFVFKPYYLTAVPNHCFAPFPGNKNSKNGTHLGREREKKRGRERERERKRGERIESCTVGCRESKSKSNIGSLSFSLLLLLLVLSLSRSASNVSAGAHANSAVSVILIKQHASNTWSLSFPLPSPLSTCARPTAPSQSF